MRSVMGDMKSMMDDMMGGAEHAAPTQIYGPLLQLPLLGEVERAQLLRDGADREAVGLGLVDQAAELARTAISPADADAAVRALREGLWRFESGVAVRQALAPPPNTPMPAREWFRRELRLDNPVAGSGGSLPGAAWSPMHTVVMVVVSLFLTMFAVLEVLRLRRIRELRLGPPPEPPVAHAAAMPRGAGEIHRDGAAPPTAARVAVAKADPPARGAGSSARPWSGTLLVGLIIQETPTVKTFRLLAPDGQSIPFRFLPGQFVQMTVPADPAKGKVVRRSYTIASSPSQTAFIDVTVKRETSGVVSQYLHDKVASGDELRVSGPFGTFTFAGSDAGSIVLIAGGVGITPMMSVLRYLTDTAWQGEIFFVYAARSTDEFVYRAEIELLEHRHPNLHVFATMRRTPGTVWHGAEGQITKEVLATAVPDIAHRRVHLCGPPGMMTVVRALLAELGVPAVQIKSEAFGPASLPVDEPSADDVSPSTAMRVPEASGAVAVDRAALAATTITFARSGVSAPLAAQETVLEAAESAGIEIPSACRVGQCGICVVHLADGTVTMEVEAGLAPEDKAGGYVLACQARTTGAPLVVDA